MIAYYSETREHTQTLNKSNKQIDKTNILLELKRELYKKPFEGFCENIFEYCQAMNNFD